MKLANLLTATSLVALMTLPIIPTPAAAKDVSGKIGVGAEGNGYDLFGKKVSRRLNAKGFSLTNLNLAGSDAITEAVCNGEAVMGITQIGGVRAREKEGCKLAIIGTYGKEFAFILFPPESPHGSLSDLTSENKVLVDDIGSGSDLFWNNIVDIETGEHGNKSDWHKAIPVNDIPEAFSSLVAAREADAMVLVTKPKTHTLVQQLLKEGYKIGDLYDKDINDMPFRGKTLYESVAVKAGGSVWGHDDGDGYEVPSVIVANEAWITELKKNRSAYSKLLGELAIASRGK